MQPNNSNHRLSRISTLWSLVRRAHHGAAGAANSARRQLLERYGCAVQRYLRKVLRDPEAANEVFQEFALELLHGDFRGANPERGRFRNFVKGTLFHLIADYRKLKQRWPRQLPADVAERLVDSDDAESDRQFQESWRDELLARAWAALSASQARTGQPWYAVLRYRADHPAMRSPHLAEQLALHLGRSFTAAGVRQILHRAREKFADLLLEEVSRALENPTTEQLEQELAELSLLDYCRPVLERHALKV